jgi:hypothetical protein
MGLENHDNSRQPMISYLALAKGLPSTKKWIIYTDSNKLELEYRANRIRRVQYVGQVLTCISFLCLSLLTLIFGHWSFRFKAFHANSWVCSWV